MKFLQSCLHKTMESIEDGTSQKGRGEKDEMGLSEFMALLRRGDPIPNRKVLRACKL